MKPWVLLLLVGSAYALNITVQNKETGRYCILLDANTTLSLTYPDGSTLSFPILEYDRLDGQCNGSYNNKSAEFVNITFKPPNAGEAAAWRLDLIFVADSTFTFQLSNYTLHTENYQNFTKTEFVKAEKTEEDVEGKDKDAFQCSTFKLNFNGSNSLVELKSLRAIAFADLDSPIFPKEQVYKLCYLDSRTSDLVPIVVGACLAGLVILVLIAYIIGRARAKRQGYASV